MRRALLSVLAIGIVAMLAGAGTLAYFSDTESSTGNTFQAGTLDVKIRDGVDGYQDDIGAIWNISNLKPGDTIDTKTFNFRNKGSIAIDHMEITCSYSIDDTPDVESDTDDSSSAGDMAKKFEITKLLVSEDGSGATSYLDHLPDSNNNTYKDLQDLKEAGADDIPKVPDTNGNSYTTVDIDMKFHESAGNGLQGDTLTVDFVFSFNQHSSQ